MISLKKYLDMDGNIPHSAEPESNELASALLESYRAALVAMGKSGRRACPGVGSDLQENLAALSERLKDDVSASSIKRTEKQVEEQLLEWGGRTSEYFKSKANEVKEILIVLARTAESVGDRDHRYADHLSQFTTRLQKIANLDDLTQVRSSLVQGAAELKNYVDQMAQDSHKSVSLLQAEVLAYESKLKVVEELALRDALTGLANRRNIEERIEWRILQKQVFCVVVLDLNGFKQVNDTHGHLAGDSLLKEFANELRSNIRSTDMVGRWGGDEFIVLLECDLEGGKSHVERMQKWVFGEYQIQPAPDAEKIKLHMDASIGLAQWQPGETMEQVIERADSAMYGQKAKKARA